jgi:hypothetical protein
MGYDFEVELREQKNRFANISIRETAHRVGQVRVRRQRVIVEWLPGETRVDFRLVTDTPIESTFKKGSFYMEPAPGDDPFAEEALMRFFQLLESGAL